MCLTLKYLLVISVGLMIAVMISNFFLMRAYLKIKSQKENAEVWSKYFETKANDTEQKYNALKDRRRGE